MFDKNDIYNFYPHSNAELKVKMADMYSSILEVDLQKLAEKYPSYTFQKINSAKTDALSGFTTCLAENGEKNDKGGTGISNTTLGSMMHEVDTPTLLCRMKQMR